MTLQRCGAVQSLPLLQSPAGAWVRGVQRPPLQYCCDAHSESRLQAVSPAPKGEQKPPLQYSPLSQSALAVQPFCPARRAPASQTPSTQA
jgi:hypothetical protein